MKYQNRSGNTLPSLDALFPDELEDEYDDDDEGLSAQEKKTNDELIDAVFDEFSDNYDDDDDEYYEDDDDEDFQDEHFDSILESEYNNESVDEDEDYEDIIDRKNNRDIDEIDEYDMFDEDDDDEYYEDDDDESDYEDYEDDDDFEDNEEDDSIYRKNAQETSTFSHSNKHQDVDVENIDVPDWVVSLRSKLLSSVAHAFLLDGNVRDYMVRNVSIKDGIVLTLDPNQDKFDVIASYDQAHGMTFYQSDLVNGVSKEEYQKRFIKMSKSSLQKLGLRSEHDIPQDPVVLFSVIADLFDTPSDKRDARLLLFIDYPDLLTPEGSGIQMRPDERRLSIILSEMCRSQDADNYGCCAIFITDDIGQLSSKLKNTASRIDRITVPSPLIEERRDFIDNVLDIPENVLSDGRQIFECDEGITPEYLAVNTAGLACFQIEDIVLRALSDDIPITAQLIKERKNDIIKADYENVIEILDPSFGFEALGGMLELKEFFQDEVIDPIHHGELSAVPMGVLLAGPPGSGKPITNDTPIPTPQGWKLVGDIKVGDFLFSTQGDICQVKEVFPQGKLTIYKMILSDGRSIECGYEHRWEVIEKTNLQSQNKILTTQQIKEGIERADESLSYTLPAIKSVEYSEKEYLVSPYIMGISLVAENEDKERSIDKAYKIGSKDQRLSLLEGICDSLAIKHNLELNDYFIYETYSSQLAKDIAEIAHSLALSCSIEEQYSGQNEDIFYAVKVKLDKTDDEVEIIKIEQFDKQKEMTCFTVDSPNHLFLVGEYIPTHNTALSKAVAHESNMNCVALNINHIMDKYVGSSERNLDRALDCAMAMQPTIIFIDEIDEALPKRHGAEQSAVNSRINKRLLEFFSDESHRGQVLILAATNYPEKIDPAFKRAGRFDNRFPMFAPDRFDRMRIMRIVAERKGYEVSCITNPDSLIKNPFTNLSQWIEDGNSPMNEGYVGNQSQYYYHYIDDFGEQHTMSVYLPDILISIIDKPKIPLYKFYRCCEILLEGILDPRYSDASTGLVESEEEYYARIDRVIEDQSAIFGDDPKNHKRVANYLKLNDHIFRPFQEQTEFMTGAELQVVASKCITIMRKWKRHHPERLERMLANNVILHEYDIPWKILYEACYKTASASGGIKPMEDNALLDTSDLDFIPDAKYGVTNTGKEISYRERREELVNMSQSIMRGGKDEN